MLILGVFIYKNLRMHERQIFENNWSKITMVTEIIKNGLISVMLRGRGDEFQAFTELLIAEDIEAVRLLRPDGVVLSSSNPSELGTVRQVDVGRPRADILDKYNKGQYVYSMVVPIYNERSCRGCHGQNEEVMGVLNVEVSMKKTVERLRELRERTMLYYLLAVIALSSTLWAMTSIFVNRPLRGVSNTMKAVREGALDVRLHTKRKDEIGELAENLNSMLSELSKARSELEVCHVEAMQKVEKMATIGELAAAIAHEIKNPLAGISGAIQVLAEDFSDDDPRREIISEVLNEIERLDKAVKDLLNFARPPEPHPIRTHVAPIIERARKLIVMQARKQGVDIVVPSEDETSLYVDPEQIQQVFLNIMINALHSMPDGGRLTIETTPLPEGKAVAVSFKDTGFGIPLEDVKDIFKPFFTTKQMGTGLGLAISKNIAEKHGGSIIVDSRLGVGSSFQVILPAEEEENV